MAPVSTRPLEERKMLLELEALAYTYRLNSVIRYNFSRTEKHVTQSVAEHVTNILACAFFFKDKIKGGSKLDMGLVARRALIHDMGEIETGDILTVRKTHADEKKERMAHKVVIRKIPKSLGQTFVEDYESTEHGTDLEGRFVRAMDKFDGFFFQSIGNGIQMIRIVTPDIAIRRNYIMSIEKTILALGFPEVARYARVATADMVRRGYLKNK